MYRFSIGEHRCYDTMVAMAMLYHQLTLVDKTEDKRMTTLGSIWDFPNPTTQKEGPTRCTGTHGFFGTTLLSGTSFDKYTTYQGRAMEMRNKSKREGRHK